MSDLPSFSAATIGETLARLFPGGTRPGEEGCERVPHVPTDVFAAAAFLLDRGDVYRTVAPFGPPRRSSVRHLTFSDGERASWIRAGEAWRAPTAENKDAITCIEAEWKVLWKERDSPINGTDEAGTPPLWWKAALALLVIADEACVGLGFETGEGNPIAELILSPHSTDIDPTKPIGGDDRHRRYRESLDTMCVMVDPYVVRVLPKARAPSVGCTMRTLSRHLAQGNRVKEFKP